MHFQNALAVLGPLFAALTTASPVIRTSPGTVSGAGPTILPPYCHYPEGVKVHKIVCNYSADQPGAYAEITSSGPGFCKEYPENSADVVCYLPGPPIFTKRDAVQDSYIFSFYCDNTGCHTSGLPIIDKRDASQAIQKEAYKLTIEF